MPQSKATDLSSALRVAGEKVRSSRNEDIGAGLNGALKGLLGDHFESDSGCIIDGERKSDRFAVVVHAKEGPRGAPGEFAADAVAAVVDASEELDLEQLRIAYERIAQSKRLTKTAVPKGTIRSNITLGIILAIRSNNHARDYRRGAGID